MAASTPRPKASSTQVVLPYCAPGSEPTSVPAGSIIWDETNNRIRVKKADGTWSSYLTREASDFSSFTQKATPTPADSILIEDAADGGAKKRIVISALGLASVSSWSDVHAPPATAHVDDEEFNGTTLSSTIKFFRQDTAALVTPTAGVDLWTVVGTNATVRAQQGFRTGWLSMQPFDFNGGSVASAIHMFKALSTPTTNMMMAVRMTRSAKQTVFRDGNTTFYLAADNGAGVPDINNRVVVALSFNPATNLTLTALSVAAGVVTTVATRNLANAYYSGQYDSYALVKRGTTYHFYAGGAGDWEWLGSAANALTVAHVGFQPGVDVGGVAPHTVHHIDYIRRRDDGNLP